MFDYTDSTAEVHKLRRTQEMKAIGPWLISKIFFRFIGLRQNTMTIAVEKYFCIELANVHAVKFISYK